MGIKKLIGVGVFLFISLPVLSQAPPATLCSKNKKAIELYVEADNYRVRRQFRQAAELLNKAIEKDRNFCEAYYRLALVFIDTRDYNKALELLHIGLKLAPDDRKRKNFYFDLGETYLLQGDYANAQEYLTRFLAIEKTVKPKIEMATKGLKTCEFALKNQRNASEFRPRLLSDTVNRFAMQYFPVLTADEQQLVFTKRNGPRPDDTEDLVVSTRQPNGQWSFPVSISPNINSPENEGTCTISADGRQLIFTSCRGRAGFGGCDLFISEKQGDNWSVPVNLGAGVNSGYWESQPALSADGRVLFYVSDRRGGQGGKDIYVSRKSEKGEWEKAVNLGAAINTRFDDLSPFIHANGRTLFFASNGRPGFGGYDIFVTELLDGQWGEPQNFGAPVNNHEDQFSLFITADGNKGYYSHEKERDETTGRLYEIAIPRELQVAHKSNYVKGRIADATNGTPLKARIELIDLKKNELISVVASDSLNGKYLMVLTHGSDYGLFVTAPGYLYRSFNFNYEQQLHLEPILADVELEPAKAGAHMVLNNIFFDYGKHELKAESMGELEKVIRFLADNPKLKIEISGHTDNQGNEATNQQLSERRAKAVSDFLQSKNIAAHTLKTVGFGSKRPISDNSTEAGRQANRRIEFRIVD